MNNWYKFKLGNLNNDVVLKLMENYLEFDDVFDESREGLKTKLNIKDKTVDIIYKAFDLNLEKTEEKHQGLGIKLMSYMDDDYPYLLKNINNPPAFLHIKGEFKANDKSIAVIGTRRMTEYGKSAAEKFTRDLCKAGVTVVSGLASGIDSIAHKKALTSNGSTIAVVGSGLDVVFPKENENLWKRMEQKACIISEYPLGTEPFKWNFPQRNRIIAGLSRGVLVCESYKSGGSLITAKIALEENRDVFAVPGFMTYPSFRGCNELIKRNYAKLADSVDDILSEYNWSKEKKIEMPLLEAQENKIYEKLIHPKSIDELLLEIKMGVTDILILLSKMEVKGLIKSIAGGKYKRTE